jgi:hypothetical protein
MDGVRKAGKLESQAIERDRDMIDERIHLSEEESNAILDALQNGAASFHQSSSIYYIENKKTPTSMTFGRRNISDRLNRTGELLPREVFCIMVDFTSGTGGEGTHYFYEGDRDNNIWELLLNIVLIRTRDKRLNEIGI